MKKYHKIDEFFVTIDDDGFVTHAYLIGDDMSLQECDIIRFTSRANDGYELKNYDTSKMSINALRIAYSRGTISFKPMRG